MGLIKAAAGAIGSTLKDQWKDAIRCDEMENEVLMKKVTTKTGVITKGSAIVVAPGQCAIIYDNGKIIDATAEDGLYTFDDSSSPSFFGGQFGEVFKEMWTRFTYSGVSQKQQAVFFFNLKEIIENKFGTPAPVPYQDWSHPIPNQMTGKMQPLRVELKCFGKYTFKIDNPALFMKEIAGVADEYRKDDIVEQIRAEVIASFQNVLNELGNSVHQIPVLELPSQTDEIKQIMDEKIFDEPIRQRGLKIASFVVESVTLDEESEKKIDNYELASNAYMQQGKLVGSYANAVENAASNSNGSMSGFMGVGMVNAASGGMMGGVTQNMFSSQATETSRQITNQALEDEKAAKEAETKKAEEETKKVEEQQNNNNEWTCPNCNETRVGKFCPECGAKKPEEPKKTFCPNCGKEVLSTAKFCDECGHALK